ncbi:MAG: Rpn family recombination-promoting nuclease/putative transposase [Ruminococcus sp.]|jgi:predicted transposase/invertase (TIGR01784 family)|nr:Rpn family recombination-promoting nuclease/putative transposase [Ruminococcus sp.]
MENKQPAMSPLADPIVGAIFESVEKAGLAAQSLVGSILAEDGIKIGKVKAVTAQKYYKENPLGRGCRVDILVESGSNENTLIEVQMSPQPIMARNLFEYAQFVVSTLQSGTPTYDISRHLPKIVVINICDFDVRSKGNDDFIQPVKQMYTKNPEVAMDYLNIYNVQLTKFREKEHDLSKPLNAWLMMLDTANQKKISVEEVIKMYPELGNTVRSDPGINQFVGQYNVVSNSPLMRSEYDMYLSELFRIGGIEQYAYDEGLEKGIKEGIEQGREEGIEQGKAVGIEQGINKGIEQNKIITARNMLLDGLPAEKIAQYTGLDVETVKNLAANS